MKLRLILMCLLVVSFLTSCSKQEPINIRLGLPVWPGYDIIYLANELGYFDDPRYKLDLIEFNSPMEEMAAYRRGDINALAITLFELVLLNETASHISQVILITNISNGGDKIMAVPGIGGIEDLRGKRVAYETGTVPHFHLYRQLQRVGMTMDDVVSVPIEFSRFEKVAQEKQADAVVIFPPASSVLQDKYGYNEISNSQAIPNEIIDVISVDSNILKQAPGFQSYLMSVWDRTLAFMKNDPSHAYGIIAEREGISTSQVIEAFEGIKVMPSDEQKQLMPPRSELMPNLVGQSQKIIEEMGVIDVKKKPDEYF